MDTPPAEFDLDADLVAALIADQHPSFTGPLVLVAHGWDNDVYRLGARHAVRLPRRAVAAPLILSEQKWLPGIAARMPVRVPAPVAVGRASADYPWPWSIVEWIEGVPADFMADRDGIAAELAAAVGALHVPAPVDAPRNPFRGIPLAQRHERSVLQVDAVRLDTASVQALRTAWHEGIAASPYDGPPLWLHGDLHPANAVIADAQLAALIDFGDLCAGDPATDLAAAWLFFGAPGRATFIAALDYDDATWTRARAWAAALALALHSASDDSPRMAAIAEYTTAQLREG